MLEKDLNKEISDIREETDIDIMCINKDIDINSIPNSCGVYIIETKSRKRYIGSSINVSNRVSAQKNRYVEDPINTISIYMTKNESEARLLEQWFIYKFNPELNARKPTQDGIKRMIPKANICIECKARINIDNIDPKVIGLIAEDKARHNHSNLAETLKCLVYKAMDVVDDDTIEVVIIHRGKQKS